MRFFHLSDLHLGLKLRERDLLADQAAILEQITQYAEAEQPDAIVIAGDLYDKTIPSAEAVELFDHFVVGLTERVSKTALLMISGNHDSAPRINLYRRLLERQQVHMIGLPPQTEEEFLEQVTLTDDFGPVHFYLLPFVKPSMVKRVVGTDENGNNLSYDATLHRLFEREQFDTSERNVLVSHQFYVPKDVSADTVPRMDSEIRTIGNIDEVCADVLEPFDYAALGHIHKPMIVGKSNIRYCGTPLACSVSEAGQQKGIVCVDLNQKGTEPQIRVLPLHPMREVRILNGTLEEVLTQACEDYVTVILTDPADLNILDMQDRLHLAFPNLLEIRRDLPVRAAALSAVDLPKELDPFTLCCNFLGDPDDADQKLLKDILHTVQGVI